jgi:hypothetical protein
MCIVSVLKRTSWIHLEEIRAVFFPATQPSKYLLEAGMDLFYLEEALVCSEF